MKDLNIKIIAKAYCDIKTKFGVPRQSGIAKSLLTRIVFEPEFRNQESLRELENFSHIWLIWVFSETLRDEWSPTVRPPRLGGNKRIGVFATRSPFRPNPIGISCVKLEKIEKTVNGLELIVSGADLKNDTPIVDIKPYLQYCDCVADAKSGFIDSIFNKKLKVIFTEEIKECLSKEQLITLEEILSQDPRPTYQNEEDRIYGLEYSNLDIKFKIVDDTVYIL